MCSIKCVALLIKRIDAYFCEILILVSEFSIYYRRNGSFIGNVYEPGSGQMWSYSVVCNRYESDLASCSHLPRGRHYCSYFEAVSIRCCESF